MLKACRPLSCVKDCFRMNDKPREVFLCPDCGGPSTAAGDGNAICSDCRNEFPLHSKVTQKIPAAVPIPAAAKASGGAIQRNIVLKSKGSSDAPDLAQKETTQDPVLARSNFEELKKKHGARRRRLKKRNKIPPRVYAKWLVIWLIAVGAILFAVTQVQEHLSGADEEALNIGERLGGEEREFYIREYPQISTQFRDFARARTASEMAEFTRKSDQLALKMGHYFRDHSPRRPSSGLKENPVFWNVAYEERPGFVEVVWDGKEKGMFEGVFVKKGNEWLLDWEQFVRYSSENWTLFHDRTGGQRRGVFRVYVEKVSEGEGDDFDPWMKVKFSPPEVDSQRRKLEQSEEIELIGEGGLLSAFSSLFADLSGRSEGFSQLWKRDPRGLRRAIVELEWEEDPVSGKERMVIKRLLAKNWRMLEAEDGQPAAK